MSSTVLKFPVFVLIGPVLLFALSPFLLAQTAQDSTPAPAASVVQDAPATLGQPAAPVSKDPLEGQPGLESIDPDRPLLGISSPPSQATRQLFGQFIDGFADPTNMLDLVVGAPRIILLKQPPTRIQIPDETVASYDLLSDNEISITGKTPGSTILNLWFVDPKARGGHRLLSYLVRVFPDPQFVERLNRIYGALEAQINQAFPKSKITLTPLGDNILVRGTADDAAEAAAILHILQVSIPNSIIDAPIDTNDQAASASQNSPATGSQSLSSSAVQNLLSSGGGNSSRSHQGSGSKHLIDLLRVRGTNQIMLRVSVAEVNRSAARSIGLNFAVKNDAGAVVFQNTTGGLATFSSGTTGGLSGISTSANFPMIFDGQQVAVALNALRTLSLAKSLAEPNLVTVSGHNATFQAGGEFPVPVVTGATSTGLQGVEFIPFGVELNFTPYLPEKDRIRLNLNGTVSTRDDADSAIVGNTSVPSLNNRTFQTTVDLKPGQSFAIAGLVQQNMASNSAHVPFFGDLPILANLLGSSQTSSAEQELVILVTADLVQPLDQSQVPPLPGHDIFDPNDIEFYVLGRLESRYPRDSRSALQTDWDRMVRYQQLQKQIIIGPSGYSDDRTPTTAPTTGGTR